MNTKSTTTLSSLTLAALFTVAMLAGVNGLATAGNGASAPQVAQVAATRA